MQKKLQITKLNKKVARTISFIVLAALFSYFICQRFFILNITSSVPIGLWYKKSNATLERGTYVQVPITAFSYFDWIPSDYPPIRREGRKTTFLKQVLGLPGDTITMTSTGRLTVNNMIIPNSKPLEHDRSGNALNTIEFPITLKNGQVWLMGTSSPYSFDSRYLGPANIKDCHSVSPFLTN
ncbi:S26 family signal peptidase [Jonquetella anthropi]|uniref:S26 family signal peptidase n=1 Tax=Jonquetella anthropi TaxID=428712 RepID=UPI0001B91206|nr:putative conjugative transfer signal peptidase TraF [Jonquetella anthropi E3_33 E1]